MCWHQSQRCLLLSARRLPDHDAAAVRQGDQYQLGVGLMGNAGQAQLCGVEGWVDRADSCRGEGAGLAQRPGQRDRSRLHRDGHDEGLPDGVKQRLLERIPLGRFGQAEEVARAALFLAAAQRLHHRTSPVRVWRTSDVGSGRRRRGPKTRAAGAPACLWENVADRSAQTRLVIRRRATAWRSTNASSRSL